MINYSRVFQTTRRRFQFSFITAFVCLMLLFLPSCQKEIEGDGDPVSLEAVQKSDKKASIEGQKSITGAEDEEGHFSVDVRSVPDIYDILIREFGDFADSKRSEKDKWPFGIKGVGDKVYKLTSGGVTTYTFQMLTNRPEKSLLYNAIVTIYENGEADETILLRYKLKDDFAEKLIRKEAHFSQYKGQIKAYLLGDLDPLQRGTGPCQTATFGGGGGGDYSGVPSSSSGESTAAGGTQVCRWEAEGVCVRTCCCARSCCDEWATQVSVTCTSLRRSGSACTNIANFIANYPYDSDPSSSYANLNEEMYWHLGTSGFSYTMIAEFNKMLPNFQAAIREDGWTWPASSEEWRDLAELILLELQDLRGWANLVIPLSEIESALKNYKNGSHWGAAFDITMAAASFIPVGKAGKTAKFTAKKVTRASKVMKVYRTVKALGNSKVWKGFKGTIRKNYKNPGKIFSSHHLANSEFTRLLGKFGGQQEFIAQAYKNAYKQGHLNISSTGVPKYFNFTIDGVPMRGSAIKVSSSEIRLDDFWVLGPEAPH